MGTWKTPTWALRISEKDRDEIKRRAAAEGLSASEYVRRAALGRSSDIRVGRPPKDSSPGSGRSQRERDAAWGADTELEVRTEKRAP